MWCFAEQQAVSTVQGDAKDESNITSGAYGMETYQSDSGAQMCVREKKETERERETVK